jgi:hypothetical protein
MPYLAEAIARANEVFAPATDFAPSALLEGFENTSTVQEAASTLGLLDVLDEEQRQSMADFLATIPPAINAAIMAATRDALARGVRVMFSWQPGYDFELRVWEVAEGARGMVNLHVTSPHPIETEPLATSNQ